MSLQELVVQIVHHPDLLLPDVYNLGFGPPDGNNGFLDNISLQHENLEKIFSTILFLPLALLQQIKSVISVHYHVQAFYPHHHFPMASAGF